MITCTFEHGKSASLRHAVTDNIVLDGDKILLVHRAAHLVEGGKWCLPGGYMERDETIAEAAAREILEETGYSVEGLTLFRIIDNPHTRGEDRQNISFVHFCRAGVQTGTPDDESDDMRWFPFDGLPPVAQMAFDHAEIIQQYRTWRNRPVSLPLTG
jgi:8-oxo-dGTP diphosphatase